MIFALALQLVDLPAQLLVSSCPLHCVPAVGHHVSQKHTCRKAIICTWHVECVHADYILLQRKMVHHQTSQQAKAYLLRAHCLAEASQFMVNVLLEVRGVCLVGMRC